MKDKRKEDLKEDSLEKEYWSNDDCVRRSIH